MPDNFASSPILRPAHSAVQPLPDAASDSGYAVNALRIAAIYVQLSLQAGFIQSGVIVIDITTLKAHKVDKTPQRRHSAFTEYVRNNRLPEPVIRVNSQRWRDLAPTYPHCSSISAQTLLPGCMREVTDCGLSFLMAENRVEANAHNAGSCPASNAIHGHINDFLVRTGLRSGVSELQLPCFTAVRAEIALMSGGAFAVTHHPVSS